MFEISVYYTNGTSDTITCTNKLLQKVMTGWGKEHTLNPVISQKSDAEKLMWVTLIAIKGVSF